MDTNVVENVQQQGKEVLQNNANTSPVDYAAYFFSTYHKTFTSLVSRLSKKDLERLNTALVLYPLEVEEPKFNSENGKAAFALGINLIDCKMIMRNAIEMENFLETESGEVNGETSPVNNDTVIENGEQNNGKVE